MPKPLRNNRMWGRILHSVFRPALFVRDILKRVEKREQGNRLGQP